MRQSTMLAALLVLSLPMAVVAQPPVAPQTVAAGPATFKIDPTHSELTFQIRHMVSRVRGTFTDWSGSLTGDPASWQAGSADIQIQTASITTHNERRDADLRSPNFFEAEKNPAISFKSTRLERKGEELKLYGDLTIKGVTKPVMLDGHFLGMTTARGKRRIGFDASTTINRLDYGVTWNRALEGGGMLLGDEVKIEIVVAAQEQ